MSIMELRMKRLFYLFLVSLALVVLPGGYAFPDFNTAKIERIKFTDEDIPSGFVYGKIPRFYKHILKGNPWTMDRTAIQKLASRIYPGGDSSSISTIHMAIVANKKTPFGDDIVCYVFLFRDSSSAKKEIQKINDFTKYNSDRAIVLSRENMAVFLHVDDINNFRLIQGIADNFRTRLQTL